MKQLSMNKLFICLIILLSSTAHATGYNKMIVFGDSLSDNGNLAHAAPFIAPEFVFLNDEPYAKGFTNGPTAVVQLANLLNVALTPSDYLLGLLNGYNFAVAGARARGGNSIDLNSQIGAFLLTQSGGIPQDALYVLFIGGNDIRDMRDQTDIKTAYGFLKTAMTNIKNGLSQLIALGAKHVLVVNSPDIGKLPETVAGAAKDKTLIQRASLATLVYNQSLAKTVKTVETNTGVDIVLFDVYTLFNNIVKDRRAYLYTNAKAACYSTQLQDYFTICNKNVMDSFVFFDEIHPTQRVHERVGRAMFAVVPDAN